mmetsp:Transcript_45187/g.88409  ORF Transcript_45187/g.88409 Transcript_45187/m.88409 type:complete len:465 (-) Transcript_45187:771-2165(-)
MRSSAFSIAAAAAAAFFPCTAAQPLDPERLPPDKNSDGVSNRSPDLQYYGSFCGDFLGGEDSDPHAVHGIELQSGGFAVAGKYNMASSVAGGFVVTAKSKPAAWKNGKHYSLTKNQAWVTTFGNEFAISGIAAANGANAVVELGKHLYAAGFTASSKSQIVATLLKIKTETGAVEWTYRYNGGSKTSAFEGVQISTDGTGIVVSGLVDAKNAGCIEGFKSYGNPACGTAVLMKFDGGALAASGAPKAPTWTVKYNGYLTGKNVRTTGNDGYVLAASDLDEQAAIIRTDSKGELKWGQAYGDFGEVTDLAYVVDGNGKGFAMLSGQKNGDGELYGRLARVDLTTKQMIWVKSYGKLTGGKAQYKGITEGNPNKWVYHECWSIATTENNEQVILACGVGIEGCKNSDKACKADPRNNWRSFIFGADATTGSVLWYRMDNFDDINKKKVVASASEFVVVTKDGESSP